EPSRSRRYRRRLSRRDRTAQKRLDKRTGTSSMGGAVLRLEQNLRSDQILLPLRHPLKVAAAPSRIAWRQDCSCFWQPSFSVTGNRLSRCSSCSVSIRRRRRGMDFLRQVRSSKGSTSENGIPTADEVCFTGFQAARP